MTPLIYHPLCGVPRPTVASLRAHATPDAAAILDAALRLRAARLRDADHLRALLRAHHAPPWVGDVTTWREGPQHVSRSDLLRALLATAEATMTAALWGELRHLPEAADHARRLAEGAPPDDDDAIELEPELSAPLALWLRDGAPGPLEPSTLLRALDTASWDALLAELHPRFLDGLCTLDEARHDQQQWLWSRGLSPLPRSPIAYLDRHDGLAAMDEALAQSPGVVVIADGPGRGRRALLSAWCDRLRYDPDAVPHLARLHPLRVGRIYHLRAGLQQVRAALREALPGASGLSFPAHEQAATAAPDADALRAAAARLGVAEGWHASPATVWILAAGAEHDPQPYPWEPDLEQLASLIDTAATSGDATRLLWSMSTTQHQQLSEQSRALAALPVVRVPPIEDRQLLYLWACRRPAWGSAAPTTAALLASLAQLPPDVIRHPGDLPVVHPPGGWQLLVRRARRDQREQLIRWLDRRPELAAFLDTWLGDAGAFISFVHAAEALPLG